MAGRSRGFSEIDSDMDDHISITSTLFSHIKATIPAVKRRKTGMNSRLDRMVETMNITRRSPIKRDRKRTRSAGSSVSSWDMPKTPIDDVYDNLQAGRLGESFSVIKMHQPTICDENGDAEPCEVSAAKRQENPLPNWLSNTFASLDHTNPLRLLIPSDFQSQLDDYQIQCGDYIPPREPTPEQIFQFAPPDIDTSADPQYVEESQDLIQELLLVPELPQISIQAPFSTPGPASTVSISPIAPRQSFALFDNVLDELPEEKSDYVDPICYSQTPTIFEDLVSALDRPFEPPLPVPHALSPQVTTTQAISNVEHAEFAVPRPAFHPRHHSTLASHETDQTTDFPVFDLDRPIMHSPSSFRSPTPETTNLIASTLPTLDINAPVTHNGPSSLPPSSPEKSFISGPSSGPQRTNVSFASHVFATPGPAYYSSRPVYFGSPTEDPSSDPPDASYELDVDELDFHWQPHFLKDQKSVDVSEYIQDPVYADEDIPEEDVNTHRFTPQLDGGSDDASDRFPPSPPSLTNKQNITTTPDDFQLPSTSERAADLCLLPLPLFDPARLQAQTPPRKGGYSVSMFSLPSPVHMPTPVNEASPIKAESEVKEKEIERPVKKSLLEMLDETLKKESEMDIKENEIGRAVGEENTVGDQLSQQSKDSIESWSSG